MAYVSDFEHDVFVSYAHADNQGAGGSEAEYGWVTTLGHNLIHAPGALRKDVYIDHQLKPGDPFGADLLRKVEHSALLLIVLSQNYIKSEWCGKELEHFVETHGDDRRRPRDVMVVEIHPFEDFEGVPENIEDLRKELIHAQFWYQTADAPFPRLAGDPSPKEAGGSVYWRERDKLLDAVDTRLREIRRLREMRTGQEARAPEGPRHTVPSAPAPVAVEGSGVLLADVTDDLVSQRKGSASCPKATTWAVPRRSLPRRLLAMPNRACCSCNYSRPRRAEAQRARRDPYHSCTSPQPNGPV